MKIPPLFQWLLLFFATIIFLVIVFVSGLNFLAEIFVEDEEGVIEDKGKVTLPTDYVWKNVTGMVVAGTVSKTTFPFYIARTPWRIHAGYFTKEPEFTIMTVFVYRVRGNRLIDTLFLNGGHELSVDGYTTKETGMYQQETTSYVYEGGEEFYLKINTANTRSWVLSVHEKVPKMVVP